MPLVSLPHLCMLDATPPELVKAAAFAGFTGVCIRLQPTMTGELQHPMLGDTPMMRETLQILDDTGLEVLDIETFWLRQDTNLQDYLPALEAAAKLGAHTLQVVGGDSDISRVKDMFAEFATMAKNLGLRCEYEYMLLSPIQTLSQALEIISYPKTGNVGLLADTLHIGRCKTPIEEFAAVPDEYLYLLQLCDAPKETPPTFEAIVEEARFGRLLPGEGELDLVGPFKSIPKDAHISVEVPLARTRCLPFEERAKIIKAGYDKFVTDVGGR